MIATTHHRAPGAGAVLAILLSACAAPNGPRGAVMPLRAPAEQVTVHKLQGSATVQRGATLTPLRNGAVIEEGQPIQLGAKSQMQLSLGKRALFDLGPQSRLVVHKLPRAGDAGERATWLRLERGYLRVVWSEYQDGRSWPLEVSFARWAAKVGPGEYFFDSARHSASTCAFRGELDLSGVPEATPTAMTDSCVNLRAQSPPQQIALRESDWAALRTRRTLDGTLKKAAAFEASEAIARLEREIKQSPARTTRTAQVRPPSTRSAQINPPQMTAAAPRQRRSQTLLAPAPAASARWPVPVGLSMPVLPPPVEVASTVPVAAPLPTHVTFIESPRREPHVPPVIVIEAPDEPAAPAPEFNIVEAAPVEPAPELDVPHVAPVIVIDAPPRAIEIAMAAPPKDPEPVDPLPHARAAVHVPPTIMIDPAPSAALPAAALAPVPELPPLENNASAPASPSVVVQPAAPPQAFTELSADSLDPARSEVALADAPAGTASGAAEASEWMVNVASYSSPEFADQQRRELTARGFPAKVRAETVRGRASYRVVIEGMPTEAAALTTVSELDSRLGLQSAWVLRKR